MRIIRLLSTNVFQNLAVEEHLLLRQSRPTLLLYVNKPAIVIGRTQNPWKEADLAKAYALGILVARRRSGGGTVYHDCGNLNFCFIGPRSEHDKFKYARLIAKAIKDRFSVPAAVNDRADILVETKKVSGAAYRITADRAYHHGTLLVKSNLRDLRSILKSPLAQDIDALGAASVPASVCNLAEHNPAIDIDSIVEAIRAKLQLQSNTPKSIEYASFDSFKGIPEVNQEVRTISCRNWVYGQTPRFTHTIRTTYGTLKLHMRKGAIVQSVDVGMTSRSPATSRNTFRHFVGTNYGGQSLQNVYRSALSSPGEDHNKGLVNLLHQIIPEAHSEEELSL